MLKQDDVPHSLCTVAGYAELEVLRERFFGIRSDEDDEEAPAPSDGSARGDIHTLILLSLGALLPLASYFPIDAPSSTLPLHIHIIDAHRPYNLDNLFGLAVNDGFVPGAVNRAAESKGRIWVWGDGGEGRLEGVKKSWEAIEVRPRRVGLAELGRRLMMIAQYDPEPESDDGSERSESDEEGSSDEEASEGDEEDKEDEEEEAASEDDADEGNTRKRRRGRSSEPPKRKKRKGKEREEGPNRVSFGAARLWTR